MALVVGIMVPVDVVRTANDVAVAFTSNVGCGSVRRRLDVDAIKGTCNDMLNVKDMFVGLYNRLSVSKSRIGEIL